MAAVERDNPALRDVLPKDYARPALDKTRLGQLIDLITNIQIGDAEARSKDVLGRCMNTSSPSSPAPRARRVASSTRRVASSSSWWRCWNPTRAASTTRVAVPPVCSYSRWSFINAHATGNGNGGKTRGDISIWGQESNYTTWRLARDESGASRDRGQHRPRRQASITTATPT